MTTKVYRILFEPIDGCELPVISIAADSATKPDGTYINEREDVPVAFFRGHRHSGNFVGRITEPERIVAWWISEEEEEEPKGSEYRLLLKPINGCAVPVVTFEADYAWTAENSRMENVLEDIPAKFWANYSLGTFRGRLLRPDKVLMWWRTGS